MYQDGSITSVGYSSPTRSTEIGIRPVIYFTSDIQLIKVTDTNNFVYYQIAD